MIRLLGKCRLSASEYSSYNSVINSYNSAHSAELRLAVNTVTCHCLFGEAGVCGWTQNKQEDFHFINRRGCGGCDFLFSQTGMEYVAK